MRLALLKEDETLITRKSGPSSIVMTLEPDKYYILVDYSSGYGNGYTSYTMTLDYCPHDMVASTVVDPTCTAQGYTLYLCGNCNLDWKVHYTPAAHSYGSWYNVVDPTCTKSGTQRAVCSECGATKDRTVNATGHKISQWTVVKAPSCTAAGSESGICSVCGISSAREISATGHSYGGWEVTTSPTCTVEGIESAVCASCKETVTRSVPATGHSWGDWETTGEATCTEDGVRERICGTCGDAQTEPIPAVGHTEVTDPYVEPACAAAGLTEGSHCSVCGEILKAREPVPALPHTEVTDAYQAPTCTETGLTEGIHCSVCGEVLKTQETIPAPGHTEVKDAAQEPTRSLSGKTEGSHCSVCGEVLVAQTNIPSLPHTEVLVPAIEPTCTEPGRTKGKYCSVCKTDLIRSLTLPAAGHQKVIDTPAVPATCTESGMTEGYHCDLCGVVETARVAQPIPHNYLNGKCIYCGKAGSGWNWEISGTTLTISGTGPMANFVNGIDAPWFELRTSIKTVIVEEGITHIARSAFYNCTALSSVTLPDSVTTIGAYAFSNCYVLYSITLPDGLTEIADSVFRGCNVRRVTVPEGVTRIGNRAFESSGIISISLPSTIETIGEYAFYMCDGLEEIDLPYYTTSIGRYAFANCWNLQYAYLPGHLTRIEDRTFYQCEKLYEPWISNGVTSIGSYAFYGCKKMYGISLPDSVTSIGDYAYANCRPGYVFLLAELQSIGDYAFDGCYITDYTLSLPDSVTCIGDNAFRYCTNLTDITLPANVRSLGNSAFAYSGLRTITFRGHAPEPFGTNVFYNRSVTAYYPGQDPSWTGSVRGNYGGTVTWRAMVCTGDHTETVDAAVEPTCTASGWTEGKRCGVCGYALVPRESIPARGHFVLAPDQTLVSPDTVEPGCTDGVVCAVCKEVLKEPLGHRVIVKKPYDVINDGENPFVLRGDRYYCGFRTEEGTSELQLKLNYNCKLTVDYGISGNGGYVYILLNDITKGSVSYYNDQDSLTLNGAAGDILTVRYQSYGGAYALYDRGWASVRYADDQSRIIVPAESLEAGCASMVCDYCQAVVKAAPGHKAVIDPGVEATCVRGGLTEGRHCSVCEEILVSQEETAALGHDFVGGVCSRCALEGGGAVLGEGTCGDKASADVRWTVYEGGLLRISGTGFMTSMMPYDNPPWKTWMDSVTSIVVEEGITSISNQAFCNLVNLETVTVADGVAGLGGYAFQDCTKLKTVVLPASVTSTGGYVFDGCTSLETVTLPEGMTVIGDYMFNYCKKLTEVEIPSTVTQIGNYAFSGCSELKTVKLHEGLTQIGSSAFRNCSALAEIILPDTVTSIGGSAFYYCRALAKVNIPDGVATVPEYAFYECDALTEITIPGSVMVVNEYAFSYCDALKKITFSGRAPGIASNAFSGLWGATAFYPENYGWKEDHLQGYGGRLTWQSYDDGSGGIDPSEALASGDCGTDLRWVLEGDRTLIISGNGAMPNFSSYSGKAPWCDYAGWIDHAVIEEGVTSVGNSAFNGCSNLKTVSLGNSVRSIGSEAFYECYKLKEIGIPAGLTEIGTCAFWQCEALEKITLPEGIAKIEGYTFLFCDSLTEITIPASVRTVGMSAFAHCGTLSEIIFTGSAPTIEDNAFSDVTAYVWYPIGDESWTEDVRQDYGGTLTWNSGCSDGHTVVITPAVEPTCSETGLTEGTCCSVCGKVITPQSTVPAKDHSYGEPAFEWYSQYSRFYCNAVFPCSNCSETKSVSCRISEASAGIVGQAEYTATLNETSYTDRTTEKHHFHKAGELYCNEQYHWYHCAICDIKLADVSHTPGEEATENSSQSCTVCGYVLQSPMGLDWILDSIGDTDNYLWASGSYVKIMEQYGEYLNKENQ